MSQSSVNCIEFDWTHWRIHAVSDLDIDLDPTCINLVAFFYVNFIWIENDGVRVDWPVLFG